MRILNFSQSSDGALNVSISGVIDGLFEEESTSTAKISEQLRAYKGSSIDVRINSIGGSLAGGVAVYNLLRAHGAKVTTHVDGIAASAASVIAMAGKRIVMGKGSMMMVHLPQAATFGDAEDHRKSADMLDTAGEALASIYADRTGKPVDQIRTMLAEETWMTAEQAVELGFADEVAGAPVRVEAQADGGVCLAGVVFNRANLPAPILALAADEPAQVIAKAPSEITAIDLLNSHREGLAAGMAEERRRIREIFDLGIVGHHDILTRALFEEPAMTAEAVVMAVHRADRKFRSDYLEAMRRESVEVASVRHNDPTSAREEEARRLVAGIVAGGNSKRITP